MCTSRTNKAVYAVQRTNNRIGKLQEDGAIAQSKDTKIGKTRTLFALIMQ